MSATQILGSFICLLLFGCSTLVQEPPYPIDQAALSRALSGELVLGRNFVASELPNENLLGLTPEMMAFAKAATSQVLQKDKKAEALHRALVTPTSAGGRGVTYSAYSTNSGIDAFEDRKANCLSYTLLFVSMARYLGLNAQFNEVILPPTWDMRSSNTYLFMRHVNVKVSFGRGSRWSWVKDMTYADISDIVVDLELRRYRTNYPQKLIDENAMTGQFYSNRGMEVAAAGDDVGAFLNLRKAIAVENQESYIWSNFGSYYRRRGNLAEAEAIYLKGLSINRDDLTIMHNLAGLYKEIGLDERSQEFANKVRAHRNANPYYLYQMAQKAQSKNDLPKARKFIERALAKQQDEARFYRLAIEIYNALGDKLAAGKAQKLLDAL
jgi:tetratricopeptide (TPR) repeat protein